MAEEFITVARVAKTQGRRGEVAADLFTDFPERFEQRRHLWALLNDGKRRELDVEEFWPHKGRMVFKFAGIESIDEAETLVGAEVQIPIEQRAELEEGTVFVSDLVGCAVMVDERQIGVVADVQFGAGEAPLLIVREGPREHMVPLAQEFLQGIDLESKRLTMVLPEGMLELDAPLTAEEKKEQHATSNKPPR